MFDCEQLQTPLLVSPVALIKLHRRARSRVAWTEFGGVGEGRPAVVRKSDTFSHTPTHPGLARPMVDYDASHGSVHRTSMRISKSSL